MGKISLEFEIIFLAPSLVLIFFKNMPSFKIGAYKLVLIKDNACRSGFSKPGLAIHLLPLFPKK